VAMTPDEALESLATGIEDEFGTGAGHLERDVLRAELIRLRGEAPEIICPSCRATIRARMADDPAELRRLRAIEVAARAMFEANGDFIAEGEAPNWLACVLGIDAP
jgi:hypothetical protein